MIIKLYMQRSHNNSSTYPSASILLDVIMKEYEMEKRRKESIDTRSGVLISALFVFLSFILSQFNFDGFKTSNVKTLIAAFPYYLTILLLLAGLIIISISLICFIRAITTQTYRAVQISDFTNEEKQKAQRDLLQSSLIDHFYDIVNENSKTNEDKAKKYKWGVTYFSISFGLLVIAYIISKLFI